MKPRYANKNDIITKPDTKEEIFLFFLFFVFLSRSHGLSLSLAWTVGLGLHLLCVEAAQVAGAHGIAGLGEALLAAKAVLFVLLCTLVVDAGAGALVALDFVVYGDVEDVTFVCGLATASFLTLWRMEVSMFWWARIWIGGEGFAYFS